MMKYNTTNYSCDFFYFRRCKLVTKKVKKIIRKKLYEYPIYERIINELELEKDTTEGGDINSSIRSKNKINRKVESQVIKNISIDNKIKEYQE